MAVTIIKKEKLTYKNGWDISIEITDGIKTDNVTFHYPKDAEPSEYDLADTFAFYEVRFLESPDQEKIYTEDDMEKILLENSL